MLYVKKVKSICSSRKLPLKTLASKIGVSEQGLHGMLKDETMQVRTLQSIADYFKIPLIWFFEENDKPVPGPDVDAVFDALKELVKEKLK